MSIYSLSKIASLIPSHFDDFTGEYPKLTSSAEAVYQSFDSLLQQHVELDASDVPTGAVVIMGFGTKSSWVEAYILAAAGHLSSSLADLRRAIEFSCYAMKVSTSKKRALNWIQQGSDLESRKRFARECSIPLCYEGEKYRALRELIVQYETANYYGAHGNMQTLIQRLKTNEQGLEFSYQVPKEERRGHALATILTGYRILQVFKDVLTPHMKESKNFEKLMEYVSQQIRDARLAMAEIEFGGNVPDHVYRTVTLDSNPSMDLEFKKILAEARERKPKFKGE